jgi:transposase
VNHENADIPLRLRLSSNGINMYGGAFQKSFPTPLINARISDRGYRPESLWDDVFSLSPLFLLTCVSSSVFDLIMVVFNLATRALIIAYKADGKTNQEITGMTGAEKRTINSIYARAIERGFDPAVRPLKLENKHVEDAPRTGRPSKQQQAFEKVVNLVRRDRYGREKTCADIAGDLSQDGLDISASTVWRVLRKAGYKKTKPTRKPGLTKKMRNERLAWCREHEDWTLEDWKNVIAALAAYYYPFGALVA